MRNPPSWARPRPPRSPPARSPSAAAPARATARRRGSCSTRRRQHRRLRVHRARRAGSLTVVSQLDPVRGSGGRPVLRQARPEGALLRQDRQHRRRRRGRRLPLAVQEQVPQPELVPVRGADGRLGRRPGPQLRPDLRPLPRDVQARASVDAHAQDRERTCRSRPTTSGRRRSRTTPRSPPAPSDAARAAARCSSARPTTRSSSTSAPSFDGINIDKPGRPASASATRAAARTTSRATTCTRSCCRSRVRGHARRQVRRPAPTSRQRGRRRVGDDRAQADQRRSRTGRKRQARATGQQVSRLGNPLINEVDHPARPEGQVQPRRRPPTTRQNFGTFALKPEPARLINALFDLGVKETNRTDIVQALLTGVPGLTQIGVQRRCRPTR